MKTHSQRKADLTKKLAHYEKCLAEVINGDSYDLVDRYKCLISETLCELADLEPPHDADFHLYG